MAASNLEIKEVVLRRTTPVVINSFNQLTYISNMIEKLIDEEFKNIYILDQCSTYPPLLEWYAKISSHVTIFMQSKNMGPHDFFISKKYHIFGGAPFLYTDADLDWHELAPDFLTKFFHIANALKIFKVGSALEIPKAQDLKLNFHMLSKDGDLKSVVEHESIYWESPIAENIYNAPIDTTLHLFCPYYYQDNSPIITGIRVAGDGFQLKHLPWYVNDPMPVEERQYYMSRSLHSTWKDDSYHDMYYGREVA